MQLGIPGAFKYDSVLNKLHTFHVVDGLPPDAAHDLLEDVVPCILSRVLTDIVVKQKLMTIEHVYALMWTPTELKQMGGKTIIKQKAAQNWALIRLLPMMLRNTMQHGKAWSILMELSQIVKIVLAMKVT